MEREARGEVSPEAAIGSPWDTAAVAADPVDSRLYKASDIVLGGTGLGCRKTADSSSNNDAVCCHRRIEIVVRGCGRCFIAILLLLRWMRRDGEALGTALILLSPKSV
ncbi:hypothetical protein Ancab_022579 [Ancistrocladus abbreviatus]